MDDGRLSRKWRGRPCPSAYSGPFDAENDLSATPFFLRSSGYLEGDLFTRSEYRARFPGRDAESLTDSDRIYRSIVESVEGSPTFKPILRSYDTVGTTRYVDFHTIRETYETRADKCHVSHVAGDSGWEFKVAHDLEDMSEVLCYVKNQNLGFTIPYSINNVEHQYYPDFLVRIDDGHGMDDPLNLILEVTGERKKEKEAKTATVRTLWMPAVNNHGGFGRWLSWRSLIRMMMWWS